MTQQYLVGELSSILGELQAAAANGPTAGKVTRLRQATEATTPAALSPMVGRGVILANRICAEALTAGGATTFLRDLAVCVELREWGACAGYLADLPAEGWTHQRACLENPCESSQAAPGLPRVLS